MIKENVLKLESVEVRLVYYNLVKKWLSTHIKNLFTFVPNKQFGHLIILVPYSLTMLNTIKTKFLPAEVWFTDQNSKFVEICSK